MANYRTDEQVLIDYISHAIGRILFLSFTRSMGMKHFSLASSSLKIGWHCLKALQLTVQEQGLTYSHMSQNKGDAVKENFSCAMNGMGQGKTDSSPFDSAVLLLALKASKAICIPGNDFATGL